MTPEMGVVMVMWRISKFLDPVWARDIFGMGDAGHFQFSLQIYGSEY